MWEREIRDRDDVRDGTVWGDSEDWGEVGECGKYIIKNFYSIFSPIFPPNFPPNLSLALRLTVSSNHPYKYYLQSSYKYYP